MLHGEGSEAVALLPGELWVLHPCSAQGHGWGCEQPGLWEVSLPMVGLGLGRI